MYLYVQNVHDLVSAVSINIAALHSHWPVVGEADCQSNCNGKAASGPFKHDADMLNCCRIYRTKCMCEMGY